MEKLVCGEFRFSNKNEDLSQIIDNIKLDLSIETNRAIQTESSILILISENKTLLNDLTNETFITELISTASPILLNNLSNEISIELLKIIDIESSLYSLIETNNTALSNNLSNEVKRATSVESSLSSQIETNNTTLSNNLSNEVKRASSVESSLSSQIEINNTTLSNNLSNEVKRASSVESSLSSQIEINNTTLNNNLSIESNRAKSIDSLLSSAISSEELRAKSIDSLLSSAISSEVLRAISIDSVLSSAISSEELRAISIDSVLSSAISSEISRAKSVESLLAPLDNPIFTGEPKAPTPEPNDNTNKIATTSYVVNAISNLIAMAPESLNTLNELAMAVNNDVSFSSIILNNITATNDSLISVSNSLGSEVSRATSADSILSSAISSESSRAMSTESVLSSAISNENLRAISIESSLYSLIEINNTTLSNEIIRSISAESSLLLSLSSNEATLTQKINDLEKRVIIEKNIINTTLKACSQIVVDISNQSSTGSGWYYAANASDLTKGYFVTAAHCVMEIIGTQYLKASRIYIQNPINDKWVSINPSNVYIDGIGDVAVIITNINFTQYPQYCLNLSDVMPEIGDVCYLVGNPRNFDEDSVCIGTVRDNHYCDVGGFQGVDTIFISCPGISGNSGGPIINTSGKVIGIFTFASITSTGDIAIGFGGGANLDVLRSTLPVLCSGIDNRNKRYLGLDFSTLRPSSLQNYYNETTFDTKGVYIWEIDPNSPFSGILNATDLLLSAKINSTNEIIDFGVNINQRTPGVLIYNYQPLSITISYIRRSDKIKREATVNLNVAYNNVSILKDGPLQTLLKNIDNPTNYIVKRQNYNISTRI